MTSLSALCVYCGSNPGASPRYAEVARELGQTLAAEGITLVYGGGNVGLMGTVADAALAAGGHVVGVIPEALVAKEVAHHGVSELVVVRSMHERKQIMAERADAFVALPGGIGTLEEIFEVFTWMQLGFHAKPCAFLSVAGFYDPLFAFVQRQRQVEERFLLPGHLESLIFERDVSAVLARIRRFAPRPLDKWIDRGPRSTPDDQTAAAERPGVTS